ncbi:MAG: hypothetical protein WAO11_04030 [Candidatus Acidiferrum sp.]|jgi:hypothetical protein
MDLNLGIDHGVWRKGHSLVHGYRQKPSLTGQIQNRVIFLDSYSATNAGHFDLYGAFLVAPNSSLIEALSATGMPAC